MHCYKLNIEAGGLMVSEKKICFIVFPHYKSMEANDPLGMTHWDLRGMVNRIYVVNNKTLLN